MHDLVRLFAREQAHQEKAECSAALERVLRCYLDTTLRALPLLNPDIHPPGDTAPGGSIPLTTHREAEAWLETERANLVAAVTGAAAWAECPAPARLSVRLARALQWFLYPRAHIQDLRAVNGAALSTARRLGDRTGEAWALDHLSAVHWLRREYGEMRACLDSALAIWRATGDREGEQRSLCNLADALTEQGHYEESVRTQKGQLANARATGDRKAEVVGLGNLGRSYRGLGRTEEALDCFGESLEHARRIGDADLEGFALYETGVVRMEQGCFEEAWEHMTQALPVWTRPGAAAKWRGYTWSALFPTCVRLHVGPEPRPRSP
ncbi:tetratricopeptide repeat protein [Allosalinactinospora lopnorensis]|uniref:tetratricopeptide repeat protein n=1 Tax=Allosalinactinospora lopnorensis TaxID=1352348 RepID=UPI00373FCF71